MCLKLYRTNSGRRCLIVETELHRKLAYRIQIIREHVCIHIELLVPAMKANLLQVFYMTLATVLPWKVIVSFWLVAKSEWRWSEHQQVDKFVITAQWDQRGQFWCVQVAFLHPKGECWCVPIPSYSILFPMEQHSATAQLQAADQLRLLSVAEDLFWFEAGDPAAPAKPGGMAAVWGGQAATRF